MKIEMKFSLTFGSKSATPATPATPATAPAPAPAPAPESTWEDDNDDYERFIESIRTPPEPEPEPEPEMPRESEAERKKRAEEFAAVVKKRRLAEKQHENK